MAEYSTSDAHRSAVSGCLLFFILILFLITGCGGESPERGSSDKLAPTSIDTGSAAIAIQWHTASAASASSEDFTVVRQAIESCETAGVVSITCTVYDGSHNAIADGGPWNCLDRQGTIDMIPVGSNRIFSILGWNAANGQGAAVYQGQKAGIAITSGQITDAGTIDVNAFVPTGLSVNATSENQINLSWDEMGFGTYRIYRNGAFVQEWTSTTYSDTGLLPQTRYCYTVSAQDDFGNESARSAQACATTRSLSAWYRDADNDGYGNPSDVRYDSVQPEGYVGDASDCNDGDENINPGEREICYDGIDNNCDDVTDDACAVINSASSFTARLINQQNVVVGDANAHIGEPFNSSSLFIKEGTSDRLCLEFDITSLPAPRRVTLEFQMSSLDDPLYSMISLYHYNANGLVNAEDYFQVDTSAYVATFSDYGVSGSNHYSIDVTDAYLTSIARERTYMGILLKTDDLIARYDVNFPVLILSY